MPWSTAGCWQRLDVFDSVAFDNTELAQTNADIARDGEEAYDTILSAAKTEQKISQIREEMLELERRDHWLTKVKSWILIGVAVWAGASN